MGRPTPKASTPTRSQMGDRAGLAIQRLWGDLEVIDAKHDLRVFIKPEDLAKASRQDPAACVFAQACRREFGAKKVLFFRSVAYVELLDSAGKARVERFMMDDTMRDLISDFDRGNDMIPAGGFVLRRPRKSMTFEGTRARDARLRAKKERVPRRVLEGSRKLVKCAEPAPPAVPPIPAPQKAAASSVPVKTPPIPAHPRGAASPSSPIPARPGPTGQTKAPPIPAPRQARAFGPDQQSYRDDPPAIVIDMVADQVRNGSGAVHFKGGRLKLTPTAGLPKASTGATP